MNNWRPIQPIDAYGMIQPDNRFVYQWPQDVFQQMSAALTQKQLQIIQQEVQEQIDPTSYLANLRKPTVAPAFDREMRWREQTEQEAPLPGGHVTTMWTPIGRSEPGGGGGVSAQVPPLQTTGAFEPSAFAPGFAVAKTIY